MSRRPEASDEARERMRTSFTRSEKALAIRPSLGHKTARSRTVLGEGLRCEITEGRWTLTSDISEKAGGTGQGPDPGVLVRAAFGSCLAMGYAQWAARHDVTIERIEIDVETDADAGAQYGVSDAPAGFLQVRYHVEVVSPDDPETVRAVLDRAERHTPTLDVFVRPQSVERTLTIVDPLGEEKE